MRTDSHAHARYKWWVVFMLWFICFFNYADRQAISSIFPKLKEEFHFDSVQLGLIGSAFMWVYAAGAPLAGYVGDRVRRKNLILGGCLFWSLVTVTTAWCARLWQFVTVRALEGFGETFYFPASMSLISDYHASDTRSRAMSFHQSSVYAGTIAGSWLAAWLAEHYGWRYGFYFFGSCGIVLVLLLWGFLREPMRGQSESSMMSPHDETPPPPALPRVEVRDLIPILARPTVVLLMLAFLAANFVATIFLIWTPTFLVDKFGYKLAAAGLTGSVYIQLASAISVPVGGLLADQLARRLAGGRILVQAFGLIVGAVFVFVVGTAQSKSTLLAAMTCFGLCKGLYDSNIFASLYDAIEPGARSTAAGIMNTVGWGGGALGPLVVGYFAKHGSGTETQNMSRAISTTGAVYILGAALLLTAALVYAPRDVRRARPDGSA
jgi:MFS family permease